MRNNIINLASENIGEGVVRHLGGKNLLVIDGSSLKVNLAQAAKAYSHFVQLHNQITTLYYPKL